MVMAMDRRVSGKAGWGMIQTDKGHRLYPIQEATHLRIQAKGFRFANDCIIRCRSTYVTASSGDSSWVFRLPSLHRRYERRSRTAYRQCCHFKPTPLHARCSSLPADRIRRWPSLV